MLHLSLLQFLSVILDGATQSNHSLPKVAGRNPKDLAVWPQKLQGAIVHGQLFRDALTQKKDVMLLEHVFEDLDFSFDFWSMLRPHFCKVLS